MFKKIKESILVAVSVLLFAVPALTPVAVHASISDNLCNGVQVADGGDNKPGDVNSSCDTESTDGTNVNSIIHTVINLLSLIVGTVSVIMIIVGGFKYITSGGNDSNVGGAKKTILYAVIGLVIVAMAQIIVRFVLAKAKTT